MKKLKIKCLYGVVAKNKSILAWPIVCAALALAIWSFTLQKISSERNRAEQEAAQSTFLLSKAYSEQIARTVAEIDQITLNLKYYWRTTKGSLDLDDQLQNGIYPPSFQLYVTITDRQGNILTSTLNGPAANLADREWFKFHQSNSDPNLRIDDALNKGRRSGRAMVRLTRRLDAPDGSFNGGVTIGVEPSHFASFNDENSLGARDFVSVRHTNGTLFASKKGALIRGENEVHRQPPVFTTDFGVKEMPKESYRDNDARILAWHKLPGYPLVSYVGLSKSGLLAAHTEASNNYLRGASTASFLLAFIAMIGMYFSTRLAWKKEQEKEIKQSYHMAIDAAREGFYTVSELTGKDKSAVDFMVEDCNERGSELIGYSKKDLIGKRLSEIHQGKSADTLLSILYQVTDKAFYEDEFKVSSLDETKQPIWINRKLVRSESGIAITFRDITETKLYERSLLDMANTDVLTGLPNRNWFKNFLPQAVQNAAQNKLKLAVLYIDLDDFKDINDTSGHSTGDQILRAAAERLKSLLRPQDHVVRLGGDEFTVILNAVPTQEEVAQVADRIAAAFNKPIEIQNRNYVVGTSIGISLYPQDGNNAEVLIQNSDIAMYAAKEKGKCRYQFYDQRLFESITARLNAEQELSMAIVEEQFVMHYQPKVNAMTGEITGLEALVRWNHPSSGLTFPGEFIPLAERNGCMVSLGNLIMKMVIKQAKSWCSIPGISMVPISFNISASQLNEGGLDKLLSALIEEHDVSPHLIEVELTETAMMNDSSMVLDQISAIHGLGIEIHIDDFGTGYSSLSRLQQFNMQVLKIDKTFTSKLGKGKEADILFKTIVLMAKAMDMKVVAEGVETEEQLYMLQDLACDEVQGYFISRPMAPEKILPLLHQRFLFPELVGQGPRLYHIH